MGSSDAKKKSFFRIVFFLRKKQEFLKKKMFFIVFYVFFLKYDININTQVETTLLWTYLAFMIQLATILHHYYLFKLEN